LSLYWLLVTTEGTYLGAKVVAMLYNWVAQRYDDMKKFDPRLEDIFITRPILSALGRRRAPLVLDVATGTGRVPALLLQTLAFDGQVVGLDLARDMLAVAAGKTAGHAGRITYLWQDAMQLPFPDGSFDLVTCLEALEFMPRPKQVVEEILRVTRPGGVVLTTHRRGWESKVMPGKCWSIDGFLRLLGSYGLQNLQVVPWQLDYSLVWGRVDGDSTGSAGQLGVGPEALLNCPVCQTRTLAREDSSLFCMTCERHYPVAADGVIEMAGRHSARRRRQWERQ
jgi:ubiquinone/menaquinone biosynthesis C-methylase UbiE